MQNSRTPFAAGRRRGRAFTRVELMVVMAIIALLGAVTLPAMQTAREAARRNQCRSQIHKLGIVMTDFGSRHENDLPHLAAIALGTDLRLLVDFAVTSTRESEKTGGSERGLVVNRDSAVLVRRRPSGIRPGKLGRSG